METPENKPVTNEAPVVETSAEPPVPVEDTPPDATDVIGEVKGEAPTRYFMVLVPTDAPAEVFESNELEGFPTDRPGEVFVFCGRRISVRVAWTPVA